MAIPGRTIGALARDAGVHVETIRYYERRGLLEQPKRAGGARRYDDAALSTLRFVRRAQELGFSLEEVAELLTLRGSSSARTCARVRARAVAKLADVEARIRDLDAIRAKLAELSRICPQQGPAAACPILGAMEREVGEMDETGP